MKHTLIEQYEPYKINMGKLLGIGETFGVGGNFLYFSNFFIKDFLFFIFLFFKNISVKSL
jgi:hypothetical protein